MSPFRILLQLRMMMVVGGDNWNYKTCKTPVKPSWPTNQHPAFYRPDALPVTQPAVSKQWREKFHIPQTCTAQAHLGVFQHRLWPLKAPDYLGLGCQASRQPCDASMPSLCIVKCFSKLALSWDLACRLAFSYNLWYWFWLLFSVFVILVSV